jgi:hypothetical protein
MPRSSFGLRGWLPVPVSGCGTRLVEVDTRESFGLRIIFENTGIGELLYERKFFWMGE